MTAIGIDLGGTKIEAQVFDATWAVIARKRCDTPQDYDALVAAVGALVRWADDVTKGTPPVGIAAAGLVNPQTGLALTANLNATGRPLPGDIEQAIGRSCTYLNDCRALALSEAVFGQGQGHGTVAALTLGTGIGGGIAMDGALRSGPTLTGGEIGHTSAPAHLIARHDLPVWRCGCGRMGCIETYIAGPGLAAIAAHLTGLTVTPRLIAAQRHAAMKEVWGIWCDLTADLILTLTLTVDPDLIVLGGGLSRIDGVVDDLTAAAAGAQMGDFGMPRLVLAAGGETSGARGAAYAAWQAVTDV